MSQGACPSAIQPPFASRPGAPDQESHFHAKAAEREATYAFDGIPVHGSLPRNKDRLVRQWAADHQDDLEQCWNQCQRGEDIGTIEPLP